MVNAFIDKQAIPKKNMRIFTATKDEDLCTFEGMKTSFQELASEVGENGLFVFQFSGHGFNFEKCSNAQFGLAPANFDKTLSTFVTGSVLNQWLIESGCKARHILFILDCCYAGGLGNDLTTGVTNLRSGLYVLSASTAFETSLVIQPLQCSLFSYFLAYAIRKFRFVSGALPITRIFDECRELCTALSSLMITYHGPHYGLVFDRFKPELQFFDVVIGSDIGDRVKAWLEKSLSESSFSGFSHEMAYRFSKFSFVLKYYKTHSRWQSKANDLSELCWNWLLFTSGSLSPLGELASRSLLNNEVLSTVVCIMMWSIASIQIAAKDPKAVIDPNVFLVGFLYIAAALDSFDSGEIKLKDLKEGWEFYQAVLEKHGFDDTKIKKLHAKIEEDLRIQEREEAEKAKKAQQESLISCDVGLSSSWVVVDSSELEELRARARRATQREALETIAEESMAMLASTVVASNSESEEVVQDDLSLASCTSDSTLQSEHNNVSNSTYWTVEIPELSPASEVGSGSIWQPRHNSIMPSLQRKDILPLLTEQCQIPPELLEDHAVIADSLVLQTLQVSLFVGNRGSRIMLLYDSLLYSLRNYRAI